MTQKTLTTSHKTGRLRIGNQWNAINIIAKSQTHPLKAVCELTENAIDARAKYVHILRRRKKGLFYLEVRDDGSGVLLNERGEPDFSHIATHICDSIKRQLNGEERAGIHGEFGVGVLSFWSLGEELRMASASRDGRMLEIVLKRGRQTYAVHPVRGQLPTGTRVVVGPLLESTRNLVTGEKLQRYLAAELRDRIRNTGVQVRISDRVSRKELIVTPREFEGERLEVPPRIPTRFGDVLVELYARLGGNGSPAGVAVCKDGTRVVANVTELMHFQHPPWTDGRLEGVLDFPAFNLAPGTRGGIVPDERLDVFIESVQSFEPVLLEEMEARDRAETDKASRQILRQLHKAFVNALRALPPNEYLFFDIPQPSAGHERSGTDTAEQTSAMAVRMESKRGAQAADEEQVRLIPFEPGELASVHIHPRHARRRPGEPCRLVATGKDEHGLVIPEGIEFSWRIADGDGRLDVTGGAQCHVTADGVGQVTVEVQGTQAARAAQDHVTVKFLEDAGDSGDETTKGLPSYRLEAEHGKARRSRYDSVKNEIVINSAHRDFLSSKTTIAKHRRYIGKLYAKEFVLLNFPHESPAEVMERLIEILVRTEDAL